MGGHLRPASKFASDPDDDLLVYISVDPAGEDGRAAATELYFRHHEALFRILKRFWPGRLLGDEGLVDLVQDTFRAVIESAGTFKSKGGDAAQQRRACLNWLVGIARNLLRQQLQRPVSVTADVVLDDCGDLAAEVVLAEDVDEQGVVKLVAAALDQLNEHERDVISVTMEFYRPGEKHQRLPNQVALNLARAWSTTATNNRTVRKRAMDKLRAFLDLHFKKRESR